MFPKASTYVKSCDGQIKWIYFLIEDDDWLEKYDNIWDKVSANIKKEFDRELVDNKEFSKAKIKSHIIKLKIFAIKKSPR